MILNLFPLKHFSKEINFYVINSHGGQTGALSMNICGARFEYFTCTRLRLESYLCNARFEPCFRVKNAEQSQISPTWSARPSGAICIMSNVTLTISSGENWS